MRGWLLGCQISGVCSACSAPSFLPNLAQRHSSCRTGPRRLGHPTRHFNVGMYRRNAADQEEKHDAAFFDPGNAKGQEVRHRALLAALDDMEAWLATGAWRGRGKVGLFGLERC